MKNLDKNLSIALNQLALSNKVIYYISKIITATGEWWMYLLYGLIVIAINFDKGIIACYTGLIAYSIYYPTYYAIKNISKRKRPFEAYEKIHSLVKPPDKYSLPSGHASASTISALITMSTFEGIGFLVLWPILVGVSRIILGVHYLSDTIIGFILVYICYNVSLFILI